LTYTNSAIQMFERQRWCAKSRISCWQLGLK